MAYTVQDLTDEVIIERLGRVGPEANNQVLSHFHAPDALAYQYIVRAAPEPEDSIGAVPVEVCDFPIQASDLYHGKMRQELHELRVLKDKHRRQEDSHRRQVELLKSELAMRDTRIGSLIENNRTLISNNQSLLKQLKAHSDSIRVFRDERARLRKNLEAVTGSTGWRLWLALMLPVRVWRRLMPFLHFSLSN